VEKATEMLLILTALHQKIFSRLPWDRTASFEVAGLLIGIEPVLHEEGLIGRRIVGGEGDNPEADTRLDRGRSRLDRGLLIVDCEVAVGRDANSTAVVDRLRGTEAGWQSEYEREADCNDVPGDMHTCEN
jgi:hypothetical protein